MSNLEQHFSKFRSEIIGIDSKFKGPYGEVPLVYADWIASGRLYKPIEEQMIDVIDPLVGNTHSESSLTGRVMTYAYNVAKNIIKKHVNAGSQDVLVMEGFGMTSAINRLQRILGLRIPDHIFNEDLTDELSAETVLLKRKNLRPVVFVTHMEHHSNHISWIETVADVVILEPGENLKINCSELERQLEKYKSRKIKIGAFSAASNVTGLITPYKELAEIMHKHGGFVFVDFAASAPYVNIDMHPENDPEGYLDAIYFSPHKFLGGPGSAGVLVFNSDLYNCNVPDRPGGGIVNWTNRWGGISYYSDIESREDGGTPGFLQTIRTALAIRLKESMDTKKIRMMEDYLFTRAIERLRLITGIHILEDNDKERIGVISFYSEKIHHNLIIRLLNDRFGIQARGGCSCAGTYGHYLFNISQEKSKEMTDMIDKGDVSTKLGWVRISLHPTMTVDELNYILDAVEKIFINSSSWSKDYRMDIKSGEFFHINWSEPKEDDYQSWFDL